jgi:hypothetical protein
MLTQIGASAGSLYPLHRDLGKRAPPSGFIKRFRLTKASLKSFPPALAPGGKFPIILRLEGFTRF